ncbi:MAG: methylated-DNA--[protein]-cysteine S-methyltransferase [Desulfuromonadaceae bacterium]|nr:methylated-DNA--[protein]-cysteine S-methyltransferase [Desulfuromonadaceae bacterium]
MVEEFRSIFSTCFGDGVIHASERGVTGVDLPDLSKIAAASHETAPRLKSSSLTEYASELLHRYFSGEPIEFKDIPVDLSGIPPFRSKALHAIRAIPYGDVRSYGQIAAECGSPHAARAVGGAMASNPMPVIIPCHRIVGGDGRMTGFSALGGVTAKMMLLRMEGVEFKGLLVCRNKLVMNSYSNH